MNYIIVLTIEDGNAQKVEAFAFNKESANIYIAANSWQQAQALLKDGRELAAEAMKNWKPQDAATAQKHNSETRSHIEEMQEAAQQYEASAKGKRFIRDIESARGFTFKGVRRIKGNILTTSQLEYLANKHQNNFINGSFDLIALSYKRGFTDGKADQKK